MFSHRRKELTRGIPAIVFSAIVGILLNLLFLTVRPEWFGVKERASIS